MLQGLLGKVVVAELIKESHALVEPQCSPLYLQNITNPIRIQTNSFHTLKPHFSKIDFNALLSCTPSAQLVSSHVVFKSKFCIYFSPLPCLLYTESGRET